MTGRERTHIKRDLPNYRWFLLVLPAVVSSCSNERSNVSLNVSLPLSLSLDSVSRRRCVCQQKIAPFSWIWVLLDSVSSKETRRQLSVSTIAIAKSTKGNTTTYVRISFQSNRYYNSRGNQKGNRELLLPSWYFETLWWWLWLLHKLCHSVHP